MIIPKNYVSFIWSTWFSPIKIFTSDIIQIYLKKKIIVIYKLVISMNEYECLSVGSYKLFQNIFILFSCHYKVRIIGLSTN